jgi:iron complex outermembrane recepter protein
MKNRFNFSVCGIAIAVASVIGVSPAMAQTANKNVVVVEEETDEDQIVVAGIRASLEKAAEIKRDASQVMDVITSEDVGKLPDANVAEALQRVTGVQITRVFGEGQSVSVRGLQQVRVEIDGRTLLGFSARVSPPENDNLGRSSGLDSVPSSAFGRLEVRKSPLASQVEGGLGGTVNLATPKPFDFKKTTLALRAQGTFSQEADKLEPTVSGLFTTTLADDRIGILVSAEYQKRTSKLQLFERNNWLSRNNSRPRPAAGEPALAPLLAPVLLQYENVDIDRSRFGINGALQFRFGDNFVLTADGIYSKVEADRTNQAITFTPQVLNANDPLRADTNIITATGDIVDGYILAGTSRGTVRVQNQRRLDPTTSYLFGLNGKYDNGALTIEGDAYYSRGTLRQKIEVVVLDSTANSVNGTYDFRNGPVPSLTLLNRDATATTAATTFDVTKASSFVFPASGTAALRANLLPADLEEKTGKIDIGYDFGDGMKVKAGIRFVDLRAESDAFRSRGNAPFESTFTPQGALIQQGLKDFAVAGDPNFLSSIGGNFPRSFFSVFPNPEFLIPRVLAVEPSLEPNAPPGTYRRNASRDFDLQEKTISGYLMFDGEGEIFGRPAKMNAGVRFSNTDFSVDTIRVLTTTVVRPNGTTATVTTETPVTDTNSYVNVLPSANVSVNVTDNFLVRLSASQTMQRAGLVDLAPNTFVNPTNNTSGGGNANLSPPISSNLDVSFEYYTGKSSLISGALFYKDVEDFILSSTIEEIIPGFENEGLFRTSRPFNVASAKIRGFEVGVQQFFDFLPEPFNGLGVIANYTYSDTEDSNGFPLAAASKHSYNLVGLFEKGPLSARVAYNWRDDSVFELTQDRPDVIAARSQLDAQLGLDLTDNLSLSLQATNLIPKDSATVEISNFNPRALNSYALSERRFSFGIRAKF